MTNIILDTLDFSYLNDPVTTCFISKNEKGFLSIDCGLEANYSGYKDSDTGIVYVSDELYIDSGENHKVAIDYQSEKTRPDTTVRSFPSGLRNCYSLPTVAGAKYLVRVVSFYGNYDGKNNGSSATSLQFDLHLGANYWDTVRANSGDEVFEAVFVAWASWAPVCLVNTGLGTPFVSSVELRPLGSELYPDAVTANQSMRMSIRRSMGPTTAQVTRFSTDQYDRYWWAMPNNPMWSNISTPLDIEEESSFKVPKTILQKAVTVGRNGTTLSIIWEDQMLREFKVFLHFADFQDSELREFDVYFNSDKPLALNTRYLIANSVYNTDWYVATDGTVNITLAATARSVLPPMLNAFEIYTHIAHGNPMTFFKDFDAIMKIKLEYGIKKNWMGDPCFPTQFAWDGVKCKNTNDNIPRIISIDLSDSNLHGVISSNFTSLTALEYLNLTGNQLNGPIPDSLCKLNPGSFVFSYEFDRDACNNTTSRSKNRAAILVISIAAPVLVGTVVFFAYLIWSAKRKPNISAYSPPGNEKYHWDDLQKTENRRFTHEELEKFTDNFERLIGEGGFGPVYHGRLENKTEVAVKKRSETSSHGFNEFLAEVQNLSMVYHKNLVSLVGYCCEEAHLALVYEYMSGGNLSDHLRGKTHVGETLNWAMRVRVLLDAAQGLDYLHKGCNRSIIHRDVKTSNILLAQNLQAKIADFGLSKTYLSESQTHMTVPAAGSVGYIDPEYYQTDRITESSDVYSFGVVLMEVATGQRPILEDHCHITQYVKEKVASGDISSIADERLAGDYDINSMWKVVEIAMLCTEPVASRRPSMADVVAQLKESLALEEAREAGALQGDQAADTIAMLSTFSPSLR